jgi:ABC-type transport system substrate-binding protein
MWSVGSYAASPDGSGAFARFDSRQIGGQNMARLRLPRMDQIYDRLESLPDSPERTALFREAERLAVAYMPYKFTLYRMSIDMTQKRLIGYRRPPFWQEWWHYVDIDDGDPPAVARA